MLVDLLITHISELVQVSADGGVLRGNAMQDVAVSHDMYITILDGRIHSIENMQDIPAGLQAKQSISAHDKVITPGFVDAHTHPIFVHTREREFAMRISGKSYVEIAQAGGGIRSTISTTRDASEDELFHLAYERIQRMIALGTTTLEVKSGYGLTTASELKQLSVIDKLAKALPIDIVPTFMGAHEFPAEYKDNHAAYIDILCHEMIPAVAVQGIARFCDIFTEAHVYNIEESHKVLSTAAQHGMRLKMHADEIEPMGGAELAAELHCISADHLGKTSQAGINAMLSSGTVPVLLPATLFSLASSSYAPARAMIASGLPVAIATDYNPGSCNCDSMQMVITLACLQMKMSPAEALAAATINAAAALGMQDKVGSITIGKQADLLIWDIPSYQFLPYHFGSSHLQTVIKKGEVIYTHG